VSRYLFLSLALLCGCKKAAPTADAGSLDAGHDVTVRERVIRAQVAITVAAPPSPAVEAAIEEAFGEVEKLDEVMSDWKDKSELLAFNQQAGQGPQKVSPTLFELLKTARGYSEASGGAFDPTFASLHGLWRFSAENPRKPTDAELKEKLPLVGWQQLVLDEKAQTAELTKAGVRVGLGALGDGFAAHRASQVLIARGFPNHLVLIAGDGVARGVRYDRPWRIAIRDPQTGGFYGAVDVRDEGVSTSGSYQKFFELDGVRYHHIINPRTGYPARGTTAVTVLAKDARLADGWGTTMFVLGPDAGYPVAVKNGLEVIWFDEDDKVSGTPGMLQRIVKLPGQ
jgi:FAD:protein FMN transferase